MSRLPLITLLPALLLAQPQAQPKRQPNMLEELSRSFQTLTRSVSPAVVQLFVTRYGPSDDDEESAAPSGVFSKQRASGSGAIVDPGGYIITNAHVVENALRVKVALAPSGKVGGQDAHSILKAQGELLDARVLGKDKESDLALLKIERENLPFLPVGDSEEVEQGQLVLAFGSPLGLDGSVSMGVVSSVARQVKPDDPMIYIQTDAPINPGSSGGPLVDVEGRLVGINTFILSQSGGNEGLGFSIPSTIVASVYKQLRQHGRVRRGDIGVVVQTISPLMASGLRLPQQWGAIVADVEEKSGAERAGIQAGDIILKLDGKLIENARQFDVNLYAREPGTTVKLSLWRAKTERTVSVPVGEREEGLERLSEIADPDQHLVARLGVLCVSITKDIAKLLPDLRKPAGVIVAARSLSPSAVESGLAPGDVIYALNGAPVATLEALRSTIDALKPGDAVVLQIERDGALRFLTFSID